MAFSILNFVEYLKKTTVNIIIIIKKKIDCTYIYNLLHSKYRFSLKINSEFSFIIFFKLYISYISNQFQFYYYQNYVFLVLFVSH